MPRKAKERALQLINSCKKKTKASERTAVARPENKATTSKRGRRRGSKKKVHWTQRRDRGIYKMEIKTRNVLEKLPEHSSATFSHMIWNIETKSYDIEWIATGKDDAKVLQDLKSKFCNAQMKCTNENAAEDDAADSDATLSADEGRLMEIDVDDVKPDKIKYQRNSDNFFEFGNVEFSVSHKIKQIEKDAPKMFVDKSTQVPAIEDVEQKDNFDNSNSAITSDIDMKVVNEKDIKVNEKDTNVNEKDIKVNEKDMRVNEQDIKVNVVRNGVITEQEIGNVVCVIDPKDIVKVKDENDTQKMRNALIVEIGKNRNEQSIDFRNETAVDYDNKETVVDAVDRNVKVMNYNQKSAGNSIDFTWNYDSDATYAYDSDKAEEYTGNAVTNKKKSNFHYHIDTKTYALVNNDNGEVNVENYKIVPNQTTIGGSYIIEGNAADFKKAIVDEYNFGTMKKIVEKVTSEKSLDSYKNFDEISKLECHKSKNDATLENIGKMLLQKIDHSEKNSASYKEDINFLKFLKIEDDDSSSSNSDTESDISESEIDWSSSSTESDEEIETSGFFSQNIAYNNHNDNANSYFNCENNNRNVDSDFERCYLYPSHFRYNLYANFEDSNDTSDFISSSNSSSDDDGSTDSDDLMNINHNLLENHNKLSEVENDYEMFASKLKEQIERLQNFTSLPFNIDLNETVTNQMMFEDSEVLEDTEKSQLNVENAAKLPGNVEMSLNTEEKSQKRKLTESETAVVSKIPKTLPK